MFPKEATHLPTIILITTIMIVASSSTAAMLFVLITVITESKMHILQTEYARNQRTSKLSMSIMKIIYHLELISWELKYLRKKRTDYS